MIARFCPGNQLADTAMKALAPAVPHQVSAGIGNLRVIAFSGLNDGKHWAHMEILEGSYGGRLGRDGFDAVDTLYANTRNNPIEDMESHLPLRVHRYEIRENAVAPGCWRGGVGSVREFAYLADGGFSIEGEGHKRSPRGFAYGAPGETAELLLLRRTGERAPLASKVPHQKVNSGDRLLVLGPDGGGYGNSFLRDPQAVLDDALDELITAASAREHYGVAVVGDHVDDASTVALRSAQRAD